MSEQLTWKVHTHGLFKEIMNGRDSGILLQPLNLMQNILKEVAIRAIELDDPKLNILMMRLCLYAISDPDDPEYNPLQIEKYILAVGNEEGDADIESAFKDIAEGRTKTFTDTDALFKDLDTPEKKAS